MECNRDEAIRAREIAEKKFTMQDFAGAKKFIHKAQQLYPALEGVSQWLAVIEVHIVSQTKVGSSNNETDWYGILQVEPTSDDSTIKKQYRKLALQLHPDKNKSMGAEAAFKMVGEAFGVLSDKGKRGLHDVKRAGESKASRAPSRVNEPSKTSYPAYHAQYQAAAQATPGPGPGTGAPAPHPSLTFWTSCPECRMQYQYLRTYLNYQLLCQKCHIPFLAKDINAAPVNGASSFAAWTRTPVDNNGPIPRSAAPPAPKRAEPFSFQNWTTPRTNGSTGNVAGNGHSHVSGDAHATGVGVKGPGAAGTSATAAAAAASLVQEAYRKAQKDRVDAEKELKRKEKEKEKLLRQREKEALRKAREEAKSKEAFDRLMNKRKETIEKEAKRQAGRKDLSRKRLSKRKRLGGDDDDDDDDDNDEDENEDEVGSPTAKSNPTRRSCRRKRNVAYGQDGSDDDDFVPPSEAKKPSISGNGGEVGCGSTSEKGKSMMDSDDEMWIERGADNNCVKERDSGSAFVNDTRLKDPLHERLAERFRRDLAAKLGRVPGLTVPRQGLARPKTEDEHGKKLEEGMDCAANSVNDSKNSSFCTGKPGGHVDVDTLKQNEQEIHHRANFPDGPEKDVPSPVGSEEDVINVPDPDFHDFDADRTEAHVKKNQVWAVFDDTDGMPRFYCQVTKVRRTPFMVYGSWLEPVHPLKDSFHWLNERELSLSTGEFQLGDDIEFDQINTFSHLMPIRRCKNLYEVYPKRSEVWAIFRDYDKDIPKSNADGRVPFRYSFVEIKSDFSAVTGGGGVVALEKLQGYKTLWIPQGDVYPLSVRTLHKFSHRVPALRITEGDLPGVPADCLELDPASTPADAVETSANAT
ncbi:uncharacterized protein [Physcomitrium patens]|uniref:J domain-containing protein n=2 Tax=Physcomitrium patens TaxID=3218 RepID=A0A7I4F856_PHYPA|nr:uncharacterized protein LOC112294622 isoform X1 [Physcomitrium patens]|eukprot:XP_024401060.1 uncharacterized protein LOC112294622 isoform X1 [Physcomitrella patens]